MVFKKGSGDVLNLYTVAVLFVIISLTVFSILYINFYDSKITGSYVGGACLTDGDCASGQICQNGLCFLAPTGCSQNSECSSGRI